MNFGLSIVSKWIENGFSSSNFPLIMMPKFWIHLYRKVADDKDKRNERIVSQNYIKFLITNEMHVEILQEYQWLF